MYSLSLHYKWKHQKSMGIFSAPQHPWGGSCPGGSVAIGNPERHVRKASHRGSKQQWRSCSQSLLLWLARATHMMVLFFTHITFVVNHTINATPPEWLQHYIIGKLKNSSQIYYFFIIDKMSPRAGYQRLSTSDGVSRLGLENHFCEFRSRRLQVSVTAYCLQTWNIANKWFS